MVSECGAAWRSEAQIGGWLCAGKRGAAASSLQGYRMRREEKKREWRRAKREYRLCRLLRPLAFLYRGGTGGYRHRRAVLKLKRDTWRVSLEYQGFTHASQRLDIVRHQTFKHSGNAGDIIYALPTMRAVLAAGERAQLFLRIGVLSDSVFEYPHPSGNVRLNEAMFENVRALIEAQPYMYSCVAFAGQQIDCDFDRFRASPLLQDRGSIARWYTYIEGVHVDLTQPWLRVPTIESGIPPIVVARSRRYRHPALCYRFLQRYREVGFVGTADEYQDFKAAVPRAVYLEVGNFYELAQVISAAQVFIGNQSAPFAVAEGMKIHRILEPSPLTPNVIPEGGEYIEAYFQDTLERAVRMCLDNGTFGGRGV